MRLVSVLCARRDSIYFDYPGVSVFTLDNDAYTWQGGTPVIAHPPCGQWARLRSFARYNPYEKALAVFCVEQVIRYGGVLEHPAWSTLWKAAELPPPGVVSDIGFTLPITQFMFGHRANKPTWLFISGLKPSDLPRVPFALGEAPCVIATNTRSPKRRPAVTDREREATPPLLAEFLIELARRTVHT